MARGGYISKQASRVLVFLEDFQKQWTCEEPEQEIRNVNILSVRGCLCLCLDEWVCGCFWREGGLCSFISGEGCVCAVRELRRRVLLCAYTPENEHMDT